MRVLVAGPYGGYNLGDEFILHSIAHTLTERGHEVIATSGDRNYTQQHHGVASVPLLDLKKVKFTALSEVRKVDALVIGGGQQIHEGRLGNPIWGFLPNLCHLSQVAAKHNIPVFWWSVGVSPIQTRMGKWMVRRAAMAARVILVRDHRSHERLTGLGIDDKRIQLAADPVFAVQRARHQESRQYIEQLLGTDLQNRPIILFAPAADYQIGIGHLPSLIHGVRQAALDMNALVLVKAMDQRQRFDASLLLRHEFQTDPIFRLLPMQPFSETALRFLFAGVDLTVSTRMHALILSATQGTPWVNIARSEKMTALSERLGVPSLSTVDLQADSVTSSITVSLKRGRSEWQQTHDGNLQSAIASSRRSVEVFQARIEGGR